MDKYLANRSDQIVDTAIRCLTNLSKNDVFTESSMALGESAKKEEDPSLKEKIIKALNKTAEAIENHGKTTKDTAKESTKRVNSWKGLPNKKVEVRDTKRLKTIAKNTQKEIKRAQAEGADKSVLDKIMDTYREHKKAIIVTTAISLVAIPALISGIINGYNDAIDETVSDNTDFVKKLAKDVENGMDPQTASAYGAAHSSVSKDIIAGEASQYSSAIDAINKERERGKS